MSIKKLLTLANFTFYLKFIGDLLMCQGKPVISNCGTPTDNCSEFLGYDLKPVMQNSWLYLKDSGDNSGDSGDEKP